MVLMAAIRIDGFGALLPFQTASAQIGVGDASDIINFIAQIASTVLTFVHVMMWILFKLLDIVLDPNIIFDKPPVGTGALYNMLRSIWQLSRDLMNIMFALFLVAGALYVVITTKKDFIQNHAPKFVMAIAFVNFSWFVPQVIYDASQVVAYTVYQIPSLLPGEEAKTCTVPKDDLPEGADPSDPANRKDCAIVTKVLILDKRTEAQLEAQPNAGDWHCPLENFVCYQEHPWNSQIATSPQSKIINGLIINHARLSVLVRTIDAGGGIPGEEVNPITRVIMYVVKVMLVLVINLALFFPMLAMVVAFFIRIPILWITMAFMPFVFLEFVYGGPVTSQFNITEKVWKGFLTAAFMPAIVGVPLAVGFVLVNAGSQAAMPGALAEKLGDTIPLLAGISTYWQLMWLGIALFVLWSGVFAALKSNEYVAKFTDGIEQYGSKLGSVAIKAPLSIPMIPGPGGKGISPLNALKITDSRQWDALLSNTGSLTDAMGGMKSRAFGGGGAAGREASAKAAANTAKIILHKKIVTDNFFIKNDNDQKKVIDELRQNHKDIFEHGNDTALKAISETLNLQNDQAKKDALQKAINSIVQP